MAHREIIIYTDGGAINNPGRAGIGVVIKFNGKVKEYAKEIGTKTNNQAEYSAVIFALEKVKQIFGKNNLSQLKIILNLDSELVAKQISNKYKIKEKELFPYFIKFHNLSLEFGEIKINLIPRENNLADRLVKRILFHKFSTLI
jgi:ribonuclease HI